MTNDSNKTGYLFSREPIVIGRPNHNEVILLQVHWKSIVSHVHKIHFSKHINLPFIIAGAMTPCIFESIQNLLLDKEVDIISLSVYFVSFVISFALAKIIPFLGDGLFRDNELHLNELKGIIDEIDYDSKHMV